MRRFFGLSPRYRLALLMSMAVLCIGGLVAITGAGVGPVALYSAWIFPDGKVQIAVSVPEERLLEKTILQSGADEITLTAADTPETVTRWIVLDAGDSLVNLYPAVSAAVRRFLNETDDPTGILLVDHAVRVFEPTPDKIRRSAFLDSYIATAGQPACPADALNTLAEVGRAPGIVWRVLVITGGSTASPGDCETTKYPDLNAPVDVLTIGSETDEALIALANQSGGLALSADLRRIESRLTEIQTRWQQPVYLLSGSAAESGAEALSLEFTLSDGSSGTLELHPVILPSPTASATMTFTPTSTLTATRERSATPVPRQVIVATEPESIALAATRAATANRATSTASVTVIPTVTATDTPTATKTATQTATATSTNTPTATATSTATATYTATSTATHTATDTATATNTATATQTATPIRMIIVPPLNGNIPPDTLPTLTNPDPTPSSQAQETLPVPQTPGAGLEVWLVIVTVLAATGWLAAAALYFRIPRVITISQSLPPDQRTFYDSLEPRRVSAIPPPVPPSLPAPQPAMPEIQPAALPLVDTRPSESDAGFAPRSNEVVMAGHKPPSGYIQATPRLEQTGTQIIGGDMDRMLSAVMTDTTIAWIRLETISPPQDFRVTPRGALIGRASDCEIHIPNDATLLPYHARLEVTPGGTVTFINLDLDEPPHIGNHLVLHSHVLQPGDVIVLTPRTRLSFLRDSQQPGNGNGNGNTPGEGTKPW